MATDKRKIQEINAGSMADIAFLLLIFFLVATTMNVDTGLVRMLPPMPPDEKQQEDIKVKERNLFLVLISGSGNIMAGPAGKQEIIDLHQLKDRTKEFILNPMDDENLPEKADKEIELADGSKWVYPESQGVVSLQTPVIPAISRTSWCRTNSPAHSTKYATRSPCGNSARNSPTFPKRTATQYQKPFR